MARYLSGVCRFCRRERVKLFLKGERCYSEKCVMERRAYPPGQHGQRRSKLSDYAVQLREKQKARRIYGVLEKQFRHIVRDAEQAKGTTGDNLIKLLECRLDNLVYKMGFASSRTQARHLVRHRHFLVNGRIVSIPSYSVRLNEMIEPKERSKKVEVIKNALDSIEKRGLPSWIELDKSKMQGRLVGYPNRDELPNLPVNERSIVELYSK
ncbi:MAG: 30S ribosomal protein S4 [Deltaproteobacteria bacterium RIFOXYA12_FULL_61_11]|nr:MAG: 30S ribosomal protein S4 [Deltaproteobacteria bacterium RIFOXYA12_FULL_61_11]